MTPRRLLIVIALQALLIIALAWALTYFARDEFELMTQREEEEIETASRVTNARGASVVKLDAQTQRANGIVTAALAAHSETQVVEAYGAVVDIADLLRARSRYAEALSQARVIRAQLQQHESEYRRVLSLFRDGRNVAERVLQAAEAEWKGAQARLDAVNLAAANEAAALRQQWGQAFDSLQADAAGMARLLNKQEVLLQITFPVLNDAAGAPVNLEVTPLGEAQAPRTAALVGASPRADPQLGGRTYFYRAVGADWRVGMQLSARLRGQTAQRNGVLIPNAAVLWHAGKSWLFERTAGDAFTRREVVLQEAIGDAWFAAAPQAGAEVVVGGAQLLLSEEFRFQVKDENED